MGGVLLNEVRLTYSLRVPVVTAKKKCCKDKPRCKKCPVVLNRLEKAGHAERLSRRDYRVSKKKLPSKVMDAARQR